MIVGFILCKCWQSLFAYLNMLSTTLCVFEFSKFQLYFMCRVIMASGCGSTMRLSVANL